MSSFWDPRKLANLCLIVILHFVTIITLGYLLFACLEAFCYNYKRFNMNRLLNVLHCTLKVFH